MMSVSSSRDVQGAPLVSVPLPVPLAKGPELDMAEDEDKVAEFIPPEPGTGTGVAIKVGPVLDVLLPLLFTDV